MSDTAQPNPALRNVPTWKLSEELRSRGWTNAEIAERSGDSLVALDAEEALLRSVGVIE